MKYRTTPYILEKDGIYYSFQSELELTHTIRWALEHLLSYVSLSRLTAHIAGGRKQK